MKKEFPIEIEGKKSPEIHTDKKFNLKSLGTTPHSKGGDTVLAREGDIVFPTQNNPLHSEIILKLIEYKNSENKELSAFAQKELERLKNLLPSDSDSNNKKNKSVNLFDKEMKKINNNKLLSFNNTEQTNDNLSIKPNRRLGKYPTGGIIGKMTAAAKAATEAKHKQSLLPQYLQAPDVGPPTEQQMQFNKLNPFVGNPVSPTAWNNNTPSAPLVPKEDAAWGVATGILSPKLHNNLNYQVPANNTVSNNPNQRLLKVETGAKDYQKQVTDPKQHEQYENNVYQGSYDPKTGLPIKDPNGKFSFYDMPGKDGKVRAYLARIQKAPEITPPALTPKIVTTTGPEPIEEKKPDAKDKDKGMPYYNELNNAFQSTRKPYKQKENYMTPNLLQYKDNSENVRNASRVGTQINNANARNLSGGNVGNMRANMLANSNANVENLAKIQQGETEREQNIRNANTAIRNDVDKFNISQSDMYETNKEQREGIRRNYANAAVKGYDDKKQTLRGEFYERGRDEKMDASQNMALQTLATQNYKAGDIEYVQGKYGKIPQFKGGIPTSFITGSGAGANLNIPTTLSPQAATNSKKSKKKTK